MNTVNCKGKERYKEYFNLGLVLYGELKYLEEIKEHIIDNYCYTHIVKLIWPKYGKNNFLIVDESDYHKYTEFQPVCTDDSDNFYFAFILRGEVKNLEKIRDYIDQYVVKDEIEVVELMYAKKRLYIVNGGR